MSTYAPKRSLTWIAAPKQARKYGFASVWEAYSGGAYVGSVLELERGHNAVAIFMDERLGQCSNVEAAKLRVNYEFDRLSEKAGVIELPPVADTFSLVDLWTAKIDNSLN